MLKRILLLALVVVLLAVGLGVLGCTSPATTTSTPTTTVPTTTQPTTTAPTTPAQPVKVGALYSLSGPLTSFGDQMRFGAEMAIKDINAKGGVLGQQVQLIIRDDQALVDETIVPRHVDEFISKEKVAYITGSMSDSVGTTVNGLALARGTPYISAVPGGGVTTRGKNINPLRITWFVHSDIRVFMIFPYLFSNNLIPKDVIMLNPDYAWGWDNAAAAKNVITQYGGKVIKEILSPVPTVNYDTYVAQIQQLAPQGCTIFSSETGNETALLLKAIRNAGLLSKGYAVVTTTMSNDVSHNALQQSDIEGVWLGLETMFDLPKTDKTWHDFVQRWFAAYKTYPDWSGVWEYLANYVALSAMNQSKSTDPKVWVPFMKDKDWKGIVSDGSAIYSSIDGRLYKTEYLYRGKAPSAQAVPFSDIAGIGKDWDQWERVYTFPVDYVQKVLPKDVILKDPPTPVGDPSIGISVKDYWKK